MRITEFNPEHYGAGRKLGSGRDKEAFEAYWVETGEVLPYVLKHQHGRYGYGQGTQSWQELHHQEELMDRAVHSDEDGQAQAKAALSCLALIVGFCVDPENEDDVWLLQERVDIRYDQDLHLSPWLTPCATLVDCGGGNVGLRESTGKVVVCDWGYEDFGHLEDLGFEALAQQGGWDA
jgi:hypothetical protein